MIGTELENGLGVSDLPAAGGLEPGGVDTADGGASETSELDVSRREPWWSQLAALMERCGESR